MSDLTGDLPCHQPVKIREVPPAPRTNFCTWPEYTLVSMQKSWGDSLPANKTWPAASHTCELSAYSTPVVAGLLNPVIIALTGECARAFSVSKSGAIGFDPGTAVSGAAHLAIQELSSSQ